MLHCDITEENTDQLTNLPAEVSLNIVNMLDPISASIPASVSILWCRLFNDNLFWVNKIIKDFNIPPLALYQFNFTVKPSFYRLLYLRLNNLIQRWSLLPSNLRHAYQQYPSFLVACCADNTTHMLQVMPPEQIFLWERMACYASSNEIAKALFASRGKYSPNDTTLFTLAVKADNLSLVQELLPQMVHYHATEERRSKTLKCAMQSGNLKLVLYLINSFEQSSFVTTIDKYALYQAAHSGSSKLTQYVLSHLEKFVDPFYPEMTVRSMTVLHAIQSGNLELVTYLINTLEAKRFTLTQDHFESAATSGNMAIMIYLLEKAKPARPPIADAKRICRMIAASGNGEFLHFWLSYTEKNALALDRSNPSELFPLTIAFSSVQMAEYLSAYLDYDANKARILTIVLHSNHLALAEYLLDPEGYNFSYSKENYNELLNVGDSDVKHLFLCKININEAHASLLSNNLDFANSLFRTAYYFSPIQFYRDIEHMLREPERYKLNEEYQTHIKLLIIDLAEEAVRKSFPRVEIERAKHAKEQLTSIENDGPKMRPS